jgi:serine/threonine-protein kinase RsbW
MDVNDPGASGDAGRSGTIELAIPARPVLLQLVRMTAGVVAARADLDLDDVEDLRLAVDELCLGLMGPTGHGGRLLLRYQWDVDTIEISCTVAPGPEAAGEAAAAGARREHQGEADRRRAELSAQILDALVDEHGEMSVDGQPGAWLRMRRESPRGDALGSP